MLPGLQALTGSVSTGLLASLMPVPWVHLQEGHGWVHGAAARTPEQADEPRFASAAPRCWNMCGNEQLLRRRNPQAWLLGIPQIVFPCPSSSCAGPKQMAAHADSAWQACCWPAGCCCFSQGMGGFLFSSGGGNWGFFCLHLATSLRVIWGNFLSMKLSSTDSFKSNSRGDRNDTKIKMQSQKGWGKSSFLHSRISLCWKTSPFPISSNLLQVLT